MRYIHYELAGIWLYRVTQGPRPMGTSLSSCSHLCVWLLGGKKSGSGRGFHFLSLAMAFVPSTHILLAISSHVDQPNIILVFPGSRKEKKTRLLIGSKHLYLNYTVRQTHIYQPWIYLYNVLSSKKKAQIYVITLIWLKRIISTFSG